MQTEGMVHALHTIHDLLKPGGVLIDIHPGADRPEIHVCTPSGAQFAGYLEESDDFAEYRQAQAALDQAVGAGVFSAQHRGRFAFVMHALSPQALRDYLSENWHDAVLRPDVVGKIEALFAGPPAGEEVTVTEKVDIARLRRRV